MSEDSDRDVMRESLMRSFQQFHHSRKRLRSVAAFSTAAAIVVLLSFYLLAEDAHELRAPALVTGQGASSDRSLPLNAGSLTTDYRHISLKLMTDEELSAELQAPDSEWVLVYVGGEPRVFSSQALQN